MTTKMTKRDHFNRILSYAHEEDKEFIQHEIELLNKKNSAERKPTAKQIANEGIKTAIGEWMEQGSLYASADVTKGCPACEGLTAQRVSALLTQMVASGVLTRTEDKRKSFYSLAE